jgi:DHA1 family bicyclomycin/chloramphenicol resistance-like MFS transporter
VSDAALSRFGALNSNPKENSGDPASSGSLAFLLAALAMLGPFSVDSYLPAFPAIQSNLGASALEVQQTLTVYMLSFSVIIIWHGAL